MVSVVSSCLFSKFKICLKAFFLQGFPPVCFGSIYETDGTCRTTIYGTGVKQKQLLSSSTVPGTCDCS